MTRSVPPVPRRFRNARSDSVLDHVCLRRVCRCGLDVRHACRPRQLLRLTILRRVDSRLDGLEFLEGERFVQDRCLVSETKARVEIAAVDFLASLNRCALLNPVQRLDQRRVDLVLQRIGRSLSSVAQKFAPSFTE